MPPIIIVSYLVTVCMLTAPKESHSGLDIFELHSSNTALLESPHIMSKLTLRIVNSWYCVMLVRILMAPVNVSVEYTSCNVLCCVADEWLVVWCKLLVCVS